jgi:hypothetical protein
MTPLHVFSATVAEMFHGTVTVNSHLNAATNRAYALAEALCADTLPGFAPVPAKAAAALKGPAPAPEVAVGGGWPGEDGSVVFLPRSPHAPSIRAAPTNVETTRITVIPFDLSSSNSRITHANNLSRCPRPVSAACLIGYIPKG